MNKISRSAIVEYSQQQMFDLVTDINSYPTFLPWCSHAQILQQHDNAVIAKLDISYKGIKKDFTTKNINNAYQTITLHLVDGPFENLTGQWKFTMLNDKACKIQLDLQFSFASIWLEKLIGPVFGIIGNTMVECFHQRAKDIYSDRI